MQIAKLQNAPADKHMNMFSMDYYTMSIDILNESNWNNENYTYGRA